MEAIGAAVGTAVISAIVEKLTHFALGEAVKVARSLSHSELIEELESLELKLKLITDLLDDAESKQNKEAGVKAWLEKLKDAAYDTEDVLDDYATDAAVLLGRKGHVRKWIKGKVNVFGFKNKVKRINNRLNELSDLIGKLGLQKLKTFNIEGNASGAQGRETSSVVDKDLYIIGRNDVKQEIIELLKSTENENITKKLPVLPIVGMGGLGKTSLARLVFHDDELKTHFSLKIWAFVSQEFDLKGLLRSIIEYGERKPCKLETLESLQNETKKMIENKKFLLILDDAWSEQQKHWEELLKPLKFGDNGSKVLVTTRSLDVAKSIDGHMDPIILGPMDGGYMLEILEGCVFKGIDNPTNKEHLVNIGKQIVDKLKGSPLAAKTIGRLLGTQLDKNHWKVILESDLWKIEGQQEHDILPSLWLSYQYLSPKLKFCFSLCSLFPKGHQISRTKLSYIWIAHDIFQVVHGMKEPEDLAAEAIQDLINRSLLFLGKDDDHVVMHDLIHDVSEYVAQEDHLHITGNIKFEKYPSKVRHLSFSNMDWESRLSCDKLRSILAFSSGYNFIFCERVLNRWLHEAKCLRVLDLAGFPVHVLPKSIGSLKHLRCLNLSRTRILKLPKSLTSLYNLQALWLEDCHNLEKLPDGMENLVNLRLLKFDKRLECTIKDIGRFSSLQELSCFDVDPQNGRGIEILENLPILRGELAIRSLENVVDVVKARKASLQRKEYLQGLTFQWTEDCVVSSETAEEVLEALQPNGDHLKRLIIINYKGRVPPSWLTTGYHFRSLTELEFMNWESCADFGRVIRNLHTFESLTLKSRGDLVCRGKASLREVRIEDGEKLLSLHLPTSVEELYIDGYLAKDESLMTSLHGMTSLRRLSLVNSPNLTELLEEEVVLSLFERSLQPSSALEGGTPGFAVYFGRGSRSYWKLHIGPYDQPYLFEFEVESRSSRWVWELLQHITSHFGRYIQNLNFTCPDDLTHLSMLKFCRCQQVLTLLASINGLHVLPELAIYISQCESLTSLPSDMTRFTSLWSLELRNCRNIESLADIGLLASLQQLSIKGCESLTSLPSDMTQLTSLQRLWLGKCSKIESLADIGLPASLHELKIIDCESLTSLPSDMRGLTSLQTLVLDGCPRLQSFPESGLPPSLSTLTIYNCPGLQSFPESVLPPSLSTLEIYNCPGLQSFSESGLPPSLSTLTINNCPGLQSFPESGLQLSLSTLEIYNCPGLQFFPESGLPPSLSTLKIRDCPGLQSFPESGLPPSLSTLEIYICPGLQSFPESGLPPSLSTLTINYCPGLQSFPESGLPPSLSTLEIYNCPGLQSFPESGLPPSLSVLRIDNCPALQKKYGYKPWK